MIKLIVAVKRKADMRPEAFREHWKSIHSELVRTNPAAKKYVRKYVQCHTLPEEYENGDPPFDGTAELWFDSLEDRDRFFSDPDYLELVNPDEPRFADMTATVFFSTSEVPVI